MFERTKKLVLLFKAVKDSGKDWVRAVKDRYLLYRDGDFDLVDYEELPEEHQEERRFQHKKDKLSNTEDAGRLSREASYEGQSADKIAGRATDNPYIMHDILGDPGLVDADGTTEAVAKIAEQNPGWAKMSDLAEAHDVDLDTGDSGGGGEASMSSTDTGSDLAEAASDAASYDGDVSTADSGDLGPTGPSGYGVDAGSSGSSGGSGDVGGGSAGDGGVGGDSV